ncbi:MAG: prepilin-type N-terminal cleavage/methylation domain-containing protein [Deltaproteobacteria bacterium]|nr:prepilin-type N-terminal cleavage/methylation domain-containing protein [Deltaproteobacteria bacterium]
MRTQPPQRGITLLEIMIVIAIMGLLTTVGFTAYRSFSKADLVKDANRIGSLMRRTSELASETGMLERVTVDLEKGTVVVETCDGVAQVQRNPQLGKPLDEDATKRELQNARERLKADPARQKFQAASPEDEAKLAAALAGHHVGDQACTPAVDVFTGDSEGRPLAMQLQEGIKIRQVWVQHHEDSVTAGQVGIHFFPMGWAEKAIIELAQGDTTFTVRVHGLTGQIDIEDGPAQDADEFMMRDVNGEKEKAR